MKKQWHQHKVAIVSWHLAAWSLLLVIPYFLRPDIPGLRAQPALSFFGWWSIVQILFLAAVFYLNAFWLMPRLFNSKRYGAYIATIVFILVVALVFQVGRRRYFPPRLQLDAVRMQMTDREAVPAQQLFRMPPPLFPAFFSLLFTLAVSIAYRFFLDRIRFERMEQSRQTEHLKSELSFLRSQVSPHFIFNMLNSAVSLARTNPVQVEPTLLKLSGLLRYMLYDTDDVKVPLNQEVEYLEGYVELQQLRFGNSVPIEFKKTGVLFGYAIEPMLLIPFVENAFKHGLGKVDQPRIDIDLREDHGYLHFQVRNKFNPGQRTQPDKYSGIGLTNVRKRLDILYNSEYELTVSKNGDVYDTKLKLPLR